MAEFQEVIRQRKRMCESFAHCKDGCPLNGTMLCSDFALAEHPQKAEKIIMKWAAENPSSEKLGRILINLIDLFSIFNKAEIESDENLEEWLRTCKKEAIKAIEGANNNDNPNN